MGSQRDFWGALLPLPDHFPVVRIRCAHDQSFVRPGCGALAVAWFEYVGPAGPTQRPTIEGRCAAHAELLRGLPDYREIEPCPTSP